MTNLHITVDSIAVLVFVVILVEFDKWNGETSRLVYITDALIYYMTYSASKNILEWHFRSNVVKSAASSSRSSSHFKILCQPNKAVSYLSARDLSTTVGFFLISVSKILTANMTYQCIVCDPFLPAGFNLIVGCMYLLLFAAFWDRCHRLLDFSGQAECTLDQPRDYTSLRKFSRLGNNSTWILLHQHPNCNLRLSLRNGEKPFANNDKLAASNRCWTMKMKII